jgi:hypothetical protein
MSFRWSFAVALMVAPQVASAGVGVSYSPAALGTQLVTSNDDTFGLGTLFLLGGDSTPFPSLDVRLANADLQFHVLDLIANLASDGDILIGVDGYYHLVRNDIGTGSAVVFHPGAQLDLGYVGDEVALTLLAAGRAGVEVGSDGGPGVGIYAIPDLGVTTYAGSSGGVFGGSVGFSVWY